MLARAILCILLLACAAWSSAAHASTGLVHPNGLALDREGNLYISDIGTHRIWKLDRDGRLASIAGTGDAGFSGDGGPASAAQLNAPFDLLFDADGNLLIADTYNHRIRKIDARGVISTIVGSGKNDLTHGPVPALELPLNNPQSIALDRDGNLYIADSHNHVIRRVDRQGVAATFAGTEAGLAGDNGPAIKAQINFPQAVAAAPDGSIYISDSANSRIRRVGPEGVIKTVAGSGPGSGEGGAGFAGDGGPIDKAKLFSPADLKFNALGHLYVSDSGNNRVRLITHGVIITIAGGKTPLNTPQKLAVASDGSVYVADRGNGRVIKIDRAGSITTIAGAKE